MYLKAMLVGDFVTRERWASGVSLGGGRSDVNSKHLSITKLSNGEYWYCHNFKLHTQLRSNSSGYTHTDFVTVRETIKMSYKNNVMVSNSKTSAIKDFDNEDEALDYIQKCMDEGQRADFKIFHASMVVEPKRIDVMAIVRKIL